MRAAWMTLIMATIWAAAYYVKPGDVPIVMAGTFFLLALYSFFKER